MAWKVLMKNLIKKIGIVFVLLAFMLSGCGANNIKNKKKMRYL